MNNGRSDAARAVVWSTQLNELSCLWDENLCHLAEWDPDTDSGLSERLYSLG